MKPHKLVPTPMLDKKGRLVGYNHRQCGYDEGKGRCLMPPEHERHVQEETREHDRRMI